MQSFGELDEAHENQTSEGVAVSRVLKTFTFYCGHFVIRLTCNQPSSEAVENFQTALHVILHRMKAEEANGCYSW